MNTQFPRMHVSLYVKNIEETVGFYDKFFGQNADKVKPGYAKYMLEKPSLIISFVENEAAVKSAFGHLGFQVETAEELEQRLQAAKSNNMVELEEKGTACCYSVQDKFWVADPDGHRWEVYHFHEDVEFNDPHYAMAGESEACCSPKVLVKEQAAGCCDPASGCC